MNFSAKIPFLDAIVQCKNEAIEKALMGSPLNDANDDILIKDSSVACSKEYVITHTSPLVNDEEINFLDKITSPNENNMYTASNDVTTWKKSVPVKKSNIGANDLANYHHLKKVTCKDTINVLLAMSSEYEACDKSKLTDKANSFVR